MQPPPKGWGKPVYREAMTMNPGQEPSAVEKALEIGNKVLAEEVAGEALEAQKAKLQASRAEAEARTAKAQASVQGTQQGEGSLVGQAMALLERGVDPSIVGQLLVNGGKPVAPGVGLGGGGMHFDFTVLVKYLMDQANNAQNAALKADLELLKSRQPTGITREDLQEILKVVQAQSNPLVIAQTMAQFKEALGAIGIGGGQQDNSDLGIITRFNQLRTALGQSGLIPQGGSGDPTPAQIELKKLEWQHERDMADLKAQQDHRDRTSQLLQNIPGRIGSALARGITEGQQEKAAIPAPAFNIEAGVGEMGQAQCPACGGPIAVVPELQGGRCPKCQTAFTVTRSHQPAPAATSHPTAPPAEEE